MAVKGNLLKEVPAASPRILKGDLRDMATLSDRQLGKLMAFNDGFGYEIFKSPIAVLKKTGLSALKAGPDLEFCVGSLKTDNSLAIPTYVGKKELQEIKNFFTDQATESRPFYAEVACHVRSKSSKSASSVIEREPVEHSLTAVSYEKDSDTLTVMLESPETTIAIRISPQESITEANSEPKRKELLGLLGWESWDSQHG
jgi:hypothetical protein